MTVLPRRRLRVDLVHVVAEAESGAVVEVAVSVAGGADGGVAVRYALEPAFGGILSVRNMT